jgi:hypothetical protein
MHAGWSAADFNISKWHFDGRNILKCGLAAVNFTRVSAWHVAVALSGAIPNCQRER